jgi:putative flavoprotein involved in K+ transport
LTLPSRIDTVVIGAGQAGLTMSWFLREASVDHLVLDRRPGLGGGWLDRWDAFRLVSPNWSASFPGHSYDGPEPDGFMPRIEIADRVAAYAARIDAPVSLETEVLRLAVLRPGGFRLETTRGTLEAERVVVATGSFHLPRIPPLAAELPDRLTQLHTHDYRSESALPPGAVLVVGSGQSGVQIAEELMDAGRAVHLSVGTAGRMPRRYRGRDTFQWLHTLARRGDAVGVSLPTVDELPDRRLRQAANAHVSGHGGGHDTNLRAFAASGMTLLGRIERVDGVRLHLAPDLPAQLAWADRWFDERLRPRFDEYIERAGIDAPPDDRVPFDFTPPVPTELDLDAAAISTVIWATGYRLDYRWLDAPIVDDMGIPRQRRGITDVPGLAFLGLSWQHNQTSATLFGVAADARHLAREMGLSSADRGWPGEGLPFPGGPVS